MRRLEIVFVEFGVKLNRAMRIVRSTLQPVTIAEWQVIAWHGQTPNDPKLSDGPRWRGPCMAGGEGAAGRKQGP